MDLVSALWGRVPTGARRTLALAPQLKSVTELAHRATPRTLRILGFHGVPNPEQFKGLLKEICSRYHPVSMEEVAAAARDEAQLPDHPVLFTFDDGLCSTFDAGQILAENRISATAYVCPSVIGRPERLWFQTFEAAVQAGLVDLPNEPAFELGRLKLVPDRERRRSIAELEARLAAEGHTPPDIVSVETMRSWIDLGHSIGNHTWDHPCLDKCSAVDQVQQVVEAHEALTAWGFEVRHFAYPNGNHSERSEAALRQLGYETAVLFDHRLTRDTSRPLRLSRLRIDSDASTRRAMSILSGAHSFAFRYAAGMS